MANSIFSTYTTSENRVTSTILAVFEKINTSTVTNILQVLLEDSTIELIEYVNQVKGPKSVPDGRIKGLFDYIIETKVCRDSLKKQQIINHCKLLQYDFSRLLILTPDYEYPRVLKDLNKEFTERIIWGNFDKIIEGIDAVLQESILLLDRERFLLLELKEFLIKERLISEDYSQKVLIVPAANAWPFYNKYSIYRCQPNRTFKPTGYMGFYANGEIKELFPKILGYIDKIDIHDNDLKDVPIATVNGTEEELIRKTLSNIKVNLKPNEWNGYYKYMVLTGVDDPRTFRNENPIKNDKTSYSSKGTAFVQKQTYLNLDDLKGKKLTSEL